MIKNTKFYMILDFIYNKIFKKMYSKFCVFYYIFINLKSYLYLKYFILHLILLKFSIFFPLNILIKILILPILNIVFILFVVKKHISNITLIFSILNINYLLFLIFPNSNIFNFKTQKLFQYFYIKFDSIQCYNFYLDILLAIDFLSFLFIILTSFLFLIVFLYLIEYSEKNIKLYFILLCLLQFCLYNSFIQFNLFWFFFFLKVWFFRCF